MIHLACMCGQGFMMGPGVAKNVTAMIVEGKPLLPPDVQATFRFDRDFHAVHLVLPRGETVLPDG